MLPCGRPSPGEGKGKARGPKAASGKDMGEEDGTWGPFGCDDEEEEVDLDTSVGYNFTEMREPPPELLMPLLPFQKQFLAWAIKQVEAGVCVWGGCHHLSCAGKRAHQIPRYTG